MSQSGKKELKSDTESEEKETAQSEPKPDDDVKSSSTTRTETGKGKAPATAAAGKRRKRASGGIKRSISLRSGLNELGYSFSSDDEPAQGKGNEKETDVFSDSGTDTEEACNISVDLINGAGARAGLSIQA
ncbi:hypothetical protein CTI12_AA016640 (mitochondrion) [Artemisia annua]|uniref:Uncharacterized protein n=1 Tax=Artemisia annua TaxID=35608 RepID=A0A2U1QA18_ARTAN|nr:hypothetical protein CTI12_AA016640 [Artemisia annua]